MFLVALVAITLIGPLAVHVYIPIMPTVQAVFAVSTSLTTLTFTVVLCVMAFGTLIYGYSSDVWGRRPVLLSGLVLFTVGSIVCCLAESFEILMIGRILQAIAAGCGVVLARAIARDVYGPERLAQVIAYITAAYVLGPTLAPPVGGIISDMFGWNAVFVLSTGLALLILLLAVFVIFETHPRQHTERPKMTLFSDYGRLFRNPVFIFYTLVPAFTAGAFFSLSVYSSFLMRDHYLGSSGDFGLYFMLLTLGFMLGNFTSGRLGTRVEGDYMVLLGCVVGIITIELLAGSVLFFPDHPVALFIPGALLGFSQGLALPHAQALAINSEPTLTGTASGIVMFLHFLSAGIASQVISLVYDATFIPMIEVIVVLMLFALSCGLMANWLKKKQQ